MTETRRFHQLRCLARFRLAMQQASEGLNIGKDFRDDHWAHCMDYMRRVSVHTAKQSNRATDSFLIGHFM